jgi:hypothetical protein
MSTDISIRVPKDGYACRVRGMGGISAALFIKKSTMANLLTTWLKR